MERKFTTWPAAVDCKCFENLGIPESRLRIFVTKTMKQQDAGVAGMW